MFNSRALLTSTLAAVLASIAAATPIGPGTDIPLVITVCSGGVGVGCRNIPIVSDSCVNLSGGLSFLNKQISTATIPTGMTCTFFQPFYCGVAEAGTASEVLLTQGTWNFFALPGPSGSTNFDDLTSSFICSPI